MPRKRKSTSTSADRPARNPRREETPEAPPIYVIRPKDEKITLATLPRPARDIVCGYLASLGNFEALANLRKANKGCKASVDAFFKIKKNIPSVDAVILKEMRGFGRTRFEVELRIRKDTIPLRPHLADLEDWAKWVEHDGELACITISVRHRNDPVLPFINKALSAHVRYLHLTNLRSTEELTFINHKLLGNTKIQELNIKLDLFKITNRFRDELFAMVETRGIQTISYNAIMDADAAPPHFDPKKFVEDLIELIHDGRLELACNKDLGLGLQFWTNFETAYRGVFTVECIDNISEDLKFSSVTWSR